jgi:hypothetical protein
MCEGMLSQSEEDPKFERCALFDYLFSLIASFYDRGFWHRLPGISSFVFDC